jgi:hypothetical protein
VVPCEVYTVHVKTRSASFLVEPQNQSRRFVSDLASKPLGRFVRGLTSKPLGRFVSSGKFFLVLVTKPMATVLSSLASNRWRQFSLV